MIFIKLITFVFLLFTIYSQVDSVEIGSRIIGGEPAFAGQFPFAAAIHVETPNSRHFCAGILTANAWIITSGFCVYNATLFTIQLGAPELDTKDPDSVTVSTSTYVIHPDFNPDTLENDLGLIKIRMALTYTVYMHMIHPQVDDIEADSNVYVQGWGSVGDDSTELSNELRYVVLRTISNLACRLTYGNQVTDKMVCVAGNYNEGTCTGDMGGGLVVQLGRTYALVAVASFISSGGCESTHPSGYTRTAPYYEWITGITKDTGEDTF